MIHGVNEGLATRLKLSRMKGCVRKCLTCVPAQLHSIDETTSSCTRWPPVRSVLSGLRRPSIRTRVQSAEEARRTLSCNTVERTDVVIPSRGLWGTGVPGGTLVYDPGSGRSERSRSRATCESMVSTDILKEGDMLMVAITGSSRPSPPLGMDRPGSGCLHLTRSEARLRPTWR